MHGGAGFVGDVALVLGVAALTGLVARRLRQPSILGYLVAGLVVGPYIPIPVFADPERVNALAEFGVVLVMFGVGLELRLRDLVRVLPLSGITALAQISFLFWCGLNVGTLLGWSRVESLFLGAALCISSTMVVSKVFGQRPVDEDVRTHVVGVLVLQDVAAIGLIGAMTGVAASGQVAGDELLLTLARLAAVLLGLLVVGLLVVPRLVRKVVAEGSAETLSIVAVGLCFVLALLAEELGFSVALGAFIAGVVVAESGEGPRVEHNLQAVRDMFAAIFFVSIGMTVDPREAFANLPVALLLSVVIVAGQLLSVTAAGLLTGIGLRRSVTTGLALGQIGEFAFILATIGVEAGVAPASLGPILVTAAVVTAFTTPLLVGAAPRVVHAIDGSLPERVRRLLGLYEAWVERLRTAREDGAQKSPLRRAAAAVVLDAVAVVLLLATALAWVPAVASWLAAQMSLDASVARLVLTGGLLALLVPVAVALVKNTALFSEHAGARLLRSTLPPAGVGGDRRRRAPDDSDVHGARGEGGRRGTDIAVAAFRSVIHLAVVVAVGLPSVALLRTLTGAPYGWPLFVVVLALALGMVVRRAGALDVPFTTGAEHIAAAIARSAAPDETSAVPEEVDHIESPQLIPGLDRVARLVVGASCAGVGKTLAELDLRAHSGATVVSIRRGDRDILLPAGQERLAEGDVLAVSGTEEAVELARLALLGGPPPAGPDVEAAVAQAKNTTT